MSIQELRSAALTEEPVDDTIDRKRYGRITRFFARMILHFIMWDLIGGRVFLLRSRVRSNRTERYRQLARQFRDLAIDMGGVMIKLGQFLSARIDVLPIEIIEELRGLQDAVPPVDQAAIRTVIERELGNPTTTFAQLESQPLAAASLGQTHRAWLKAEDGSGERGDSVVVKVQRPDIEMVVRTDLAALRVVARWLMHYRPIRARANVPALMEEFAITLWEELDYRSEVENAERFAKIFDEYTGLYVPRFYRDYCTDHILVIENVESLKVTDLGALRDAGIDTHQVADRLLDVYFQQVFEESYFHADPHPGNIFIRPRADIEHAEEEPTPFDLIFIDFGMMGRIPEEVNDLLQTMLVSITTRNARGLTDAFTKLGFFLPSADLDRITEAQEQILDQIWGRGLLDLAQPDMQEVKDLSRQFKDVLFDFPFQIPQNFIYLGRALGILSGLSSLLNPEINPWGYIEQYGQRVAQSKRIQSASFAALGEMFTEYAQLPAQAKRMLDSAEKGELKLQFKPDKATSRQLDRLERRTRQVNSTLLATATVISGTILYVTGEPSLGTGFWGISGVLILWSMWRGR